MRTPTRTLLTTGAMLIGVAATAAQAPGPRPAVLITEIPPSSLAGPGRSPAAVLARLVSFDVNADDRVSRDELPERMQGLVPRGDTNADSVLDGDEIGTLVHAASSQPIRFSSRPPLSEGLPGVIRDLKLPTTKHLRALVIVGTQRPPRHANDPDSSALLREMKVLLNDEEYEDFLAAATRLSRSADLRFRTTGGVVGGAPRPSRPRPREPERIRRLQ